MGKFYFQGFHPDIKENRVQFYEDWNEFVQHKIPKERLLVFNAKQGWGPLCEFLGKPIPDGPYPRAPNVSKTMRKSIHSLIKRCSYRNNPGNGIRDRTF